jgi:hypothetical protein
LQTAAAQQHKQKPATRENMVVARLEQMAISPNRRAAPASQGAVLTERNDDLHHKAEAGTRRTAREDEASEHRSGTIRIVDVDVVSG